MGTKGRRRSVRVRRGGRGGTVALVATFAAVLLGLVAMGARTAQTAEAAVLYPPTISAPVRTAEGFELRGNVYDYGGTTTWHFEYGTTTTYGTVAPVPDATAGTGIVTPVRQLVIGLAADTTYHFRLVSNNTAEGEGVSADGTFSTAVTPPSTTTPGAPEGTGGGSGLPNSPIPGAPAPIAGSGPKRVAKALSHGDHELLTTTGGRTLYSLSAERHGKFICTEMSGCTSIWIPLTVASGVVPKGPVKLGKIHRPEGTLQVTYRGLPLYTFAADKKPGQVKGEGLKDVGTWHAALVPRPGHG